MSQKAIVLRLLREGGVHGVSNHTLVYRFGITRAAAVIFELRQDGHEITTVDEGQTADGREKLARYVLGKAAPSTERNEDARRRPIESPLELPPAVDLPLPCGCVRAADGRSWVSRCDTHAA